MTRPNALQIPLPTGSRELRGLPLQASFCQHPSTCLAVLCSHPQFPIISSSGSKAYFLARVVETLADPYKGRIPLTALFNTFSILYVYMVFEHLLYAVNGIGGHPYTILLVEVRAKFRETGWSIQY
jgi:hypothetical protein